MKLGWGGHEAFSPVEGGGDRALDMRAEAVGVEQVGSVVSGAQALPPPAYAPLIDVCVAQLSEKCDI